MDRAPLARPFDMALPSFTQRLDQLDAYLQTIKENDDANEE
jgi:hypothetical protein